MRQPLNLMCESSIDVEEAITPAPMISIDVRNIRELWNGRVAMWSGIPVVLLTDSYSDDEFERYVLDLFGAVAPGDHFIIGFGDNAPTDTMFPRIAMTTDLRAQCGMFRIKRDRLPRGASSGAGNPVE